jgi:hypothetical protein
MKQKLLRTLDRATILARDQARPDPQYPFFLTVSETEGMAAKRRGDSGTWTVVQGVQGSGEGGT